MDGSQCNVKEKVKAGQWARQIDAERAGLQNETIFDEGEDYEFLEALALGENYKESDAIQLRAESILEPETEADKAAAAIQPEFKSSVRPITPENVKEDIAKVAEPKVSSASSAAPGVPGRVDDSILTVEKFEGRRKCPQCGNENKNLIHESIDKSNIILDYPRMYGKKYKCGLCGVEWREK